MPGGASGAKKNGGEKPAEGQQGRNWVLQGNETQVLFPVYLLCKSISYWDYPAPSQRQSPNCLFGIASQPDQQFF